MIPPPDANPNQAGPSRSRALALAAALAAVAASAGDLLLLTAGEVSPRGLLLGHYLGVLAIPLYGLGYWAVARLLAPTQSAAACVVLGTGVFSAAIGGTVHGVTAVIIHLGSSQQTGSVDALRPAVGFLLPLWGLLGVAVVLASGFYARAVASGKTDLSPWMALANPLCLVLLFALFGWLVGPAQGVIVMAAPNLAHILFFGLVAWNATPKHWV